MTGAHKINYMLNICAVCGARMVDIAKGEAPACIDPRTAFRVKAGLSAPTLVSPTDSVAIWKALRR